MELELLWKLAHQLDKETFFEVHGLLEKTTEINEDDNLIDLLERKRALNFETLEEFASRFGIKKQAYYIWRQTGSVPPHKINKVAAFLSMTTKAATELNFRKPHTKSKH